MHPMDKELEKRVKEEHAKACEESTKRDEIAKAAMAAMLSNHILMENINELSEQENAPGTIIEGIFKVVARDAYEMADIMIATSAETMKEKKLS